MFNYLQIDENGIAYAYTETHEEISGDNLIPVADSLALGKKWDGKKFNDVIAPLKYKVWSKTQFVVLLGQSCFDAIVDGNNKTLRFFKYVLDSADFVDLNVPDYFAMVKTLHDLKLIADDKFAILTTKE